MGKKVTLMFGARTYQRNNWVLGKKLILIYKARTYQRLDYGQEGNIDVRSKNIPEK